MEREKEEFLLFEYIKIIQRQRKLVVLTTFSFTFVFLVVSLLLRPVYKSTTVVLPPMNEESKHSDLSSLLSGNVEVTPALAALTLLKSRTVKESVVKQFGLEKLYKAENLEDAIKKLDKNTDIQFLKNKGVIKIAVYDKNPKRAADIANYFVTCAEKMNEDLQIFVKRPMLKVIDVAIPPVEKAKPHRALNTIIGFFLGALCGVAIAILKSQRDTRIYGLKEVRNYFQTDFVLVVEREKNKGKCMEETDVALFLSNLLRDAKQKGVSLGIVSWREKEGRTFVSMQISTILAEMGRKCVLIDFDILNPELTHVFKRKEAKGIADYLSGKAELEEVVNKVEGVPFDFIPSGKSRDIDISEIPLAKLRDISEQYELVIVDTPPLSKVPELLTPLKDIDKLCLVVRLSYTREEDIAKMHYLLQDLDKMKLRIILNDYVPKYHDL